ncbi:MAG TPA: CHRD domain-containing protein [Acidimicrobiales bacterium]|nr:CHRD domain-containing protein [Acidimicrobiales bacterium]
MRRRITVATVVASLAVLGLAAPASAQASVFRTRLTGAAEVPGPGDPDGSGRATVIVIPQQDRVCYVLRVSDIEPATAAHIHEAAAGESGPVVVSLKPPTRGVSAGCVETDEADDIAENPEDYYVNVHNAEFGPGAVRGQLG